MDVSRFMPLTWGEIGKKSSYGCIRMKPSDARDLYHRVGIDTEVVILEKIVT